MWFIGMIAGLFIGALSESVPVALILALGGAYAFSQLFGKKKKDAPQRTEAESALSDDSAVGAPAAAGAPAGDVPKLRQRVSELEERVSQLERRLPQGPGETAATPATPVSDLAASMASTPVAEPPSLPLGPPATARAAEMTRPRISIMQVSHPVAVAKEPAAEAPAAPAIPAVDKPAAPRPPETVAAPAPVAGPPSVPLRDRLPEPIANLIFSGNMLVKLGVLILFFGLVSLLRYTAERVTVPIELRYAAVALVGAGLLVLGWLLRHKRAGYALILQGAGIGIFYLTTLSAMNLSGLLSTSMGFAFLFGVAVLSAALAVLQNAPPLAIVAALEGFAAPVLASTRPPPPPGPLPP